ncbi:regulatory, FmdB family domain protein [Burkholderia thailandensis MSMB121]|uniref:FmdB family zinc ribbon protein n=2 Tax=Burkholderia humptydooensis TaxID=430531 RepID=UPI000327F16D|nr:FmdB family zinc ribbon protein [Burkholderia humptydooensis]AGK46986.1 regulatory, FmdB family domain protein [Burkholderia thailandensis MSMB121]ATF34835.1 FmdB family transcriptional regulator [Burkholderia thailandensis]KST75412.1 FmdB family transcriptional regulator [Burkholderia humptydooensis]
MPIYAYRCEACGYAKDVLQKMSDAPLSQCPECGKDAFRKQVTAAGFQLKGSGWYVTDFRGGSGGSGGAGAPAASGEKASGEKAGGEQAAAPAAAADSAASAPAASAPAPAAAPASST